MSAEDELWHLLRWLTKGSLDFLACVNRIAGCGPQWASHIHASHLGNHIS